MGKNALRVFPLAKEPLQVVFEQLAGESPPIDVAPVLLDGEVVHHLFDRAEDAEGVMDIGRLDASVYPAVQNFCLAARALGLALVLVLAWDG